MSRESLYSGFRWTIMKKIGYNENEISYNEIQISYNEKKICYNDIPAHTWQSKIS
ncbi:hypothetical protein F070042J6_10860 [Bacteroides sp. f07]